MREGILVGRMPSHWCVELGPEPSGGKAVPRAMSRDNCGLREI